MGQTLPNRTQRVRSTCPRTSTKWSVRDEGDKAVDQQNLVDRAYILQLERLSYMISGVVLYGEEPNTLVSLAVVLPPPESWSLVFVARLDTVSWTRHSCMVHYSIVQPYGSFIVPSRVPEDPTISFILPGDGTRASHARRHVTLRKPCTHCLGT